MYSITIIILAFIILCLVFFLIYQNRQTHNNERSYSKRLNEIQSDQLNYQQRLDAVLAMTHLFVEAHDEQGIIDALLTQTMDISQAIGVSLVPLDENHRPMAAFRRGEFPFPVPDAWLEYLASPDVRHQCSQCTLHTAKEQSCALLKGPFSNSVGLYCFPLRYSEQELGLLNLYLPGKEHLNDSTRAFINILTDITALALKGERLRNREFTAFGQLLLIREKHELKGSLLGILENLHKTINIDSSLLLLDLSSQTPWVEQVRLGQAIVCGSNPENIIEILEKELRLQVNSNELSMREFNFTDLSIGFTCLFVPVTIPNRQECCALIHYSHQQYVFSSRRVQIIQSVSEQIALLVYSVDLLAGQEYKSVMDERTRLSREIHDGLAQTLGFLKLQTAQLFTYLERNDVTRLGQAIKKNYEALAVAYQDVRLAIDGLRISPLGQDGYNLEKWLKQTVEIFADQAFAIKIDILDVKAVLPPEAHAQLIRIVQEALSNIRKHAQASQVWISCMQQSGDFVLEIRDDGLGFAPDDMPNLARYGMRGMRERAELLGADFQVISKPGQGTRVCVRLPLEAGDRMEV